MKVLKFRDVATSEFILIEDIGFPDNRSMISAWRIKWSKWLTGKERMNIIKSVRGSI